MSTAATTRQPRARGARGSRARKGRGDFGEHAESARGDCIARRSGAAKRVGEGAPDTPRVDLYAEVTARIVGELEAGRVPWVQPWGRAGAASPGLPRNAASDRPYSGINILILWGAVIEHGYPSRGWLTFRQAQEAGGCVRKGERGTIVVYADRFTPKAEAERAHDSGEDPKAVAFLKRFVVFNVAQIDGLPARFTTDPAPLPECAVVPVAEALIAASGVPFHIGGDKAYCIPSLDVVQVPPQPAFFDPINYYRTALHELTHATGHASRLDRKLVTSFGTKDYAREELVAELGSAFLCAALGIVPTVRHADYLGVWLDVLREDSAEPDPAPVLKLFNPVGGAAQGSGDAQHRWKGCGGVATWLATELDGDGDTLFGLADLGSGCPELGTFSLNKIAGLRLPLGLRIERDRWFTTAIPLSVWADTARLIGSIPAAERRLRRPEPPLPRPPEINPLPPSNPEGG